ncbi:MAG: ChaN family lipoprotein [Pseudomonadota bacterium]
MASQASLLGKRSKRSAETGVWAAALIGFVLICATLVPAFAQSAPPFEGPWTEPHFRDHPLVGRVFQGSGQPVAWEKVTKSIQSADLVVVGETHDNTDHHAVQALVAQVLRDRAKLHTVVWEMVSLRLQPALDQFAKGTIDSEDLEAALEWEKRGWGAFDTRLPLFKLAKEDGAFLLSGNANRDTVRAIGRNGRAALPDRLAKSAGFAFPFDDQQQKTLLADMATSHCNMLPEKLLPNLALVQRLRDGLMARQAIDSIMDGTNNSAGLVITGNGHARKDRGVPYFAKQINSGAFQTVIGLIDVAKGKNAFADYPLTDENGAPLYDFVLFTPAASVGDPCEEMRKMMKQRKN